MASHSQHVDPLKIFGEQKGLHLQSDKNEYDLSTTVGIGTFGIVVMARNKQNEIVAIKRVVQDHHYKVCNPYSIGLSLTTRTENYQSWKSFITLMSLNSRTRSSPRSQVFVLANLSGGNTHNIEPAGLHSEHRNGLLTT